MSRHEIALLGIRGTSETVVLSVEGMTDGTPFLVIRGDCSCGAVIHERRIDVRTLPATDDGSTAVLKLAEADRLAAEAHIRSHVPGYKPVEIETTSAAVTFHCPRCGGGPMDYVSGREGTRPGPGDFTVCSLCGEWLRFLPDMNVRPFEAEDILDMPAELHSALRRLSMIIRERRRR